MTDERTKESSQRRELEIERAKITLPVTLQRQRIEIEKQRVQHVRSAERLKKLLADRERLTVSRRSRASSTTASVRAASSATRRRWPRCFGRTGRCRPTKCS